MKKKPAPAAEPVVSPEIRDSAKRASSETTDKLRRAAAAAPAKCTVCGSVCSAISSERLCWVCRRLKISAWRDSDIQMNAQE
ncbi:MAG: hypothetical protein FJW31_29375 [Acidobacteria bacterium]|nr:hypothetical protein [Acidobacteriota bacterium]